MKRFSLLHIMLLLVAVALIVAFRPLPPQQGATVQAGTVTFDPGNDTHLIAYFPINFPDAPVIVASLQTETPVEYVSAVAFSGNIGAIVVELQEPVSGPVVVKWIATMATDGGDTAVEDGR